MNQNNDSREPTDEQALDEISDEELSGPKINRRTSLRILSAAGLTGLAGCAGGRGGSGSNNSGSNNSGSNNSGSSNSSSDTNSGSSKKGGTLNAGWLIANIDELDPPKINHSYKVAAMVNIFNSLVKITPDRKIVGDLAKDWSVNGTKYTFQLRKGVKYHNGDDFTADDIKYSISRIKNKHLPKENAINFLKNPNKDGVVVKDDYTVELNWKKPFAPAMAYLTRYMRVATAVNKNAIEKLGKKYSFKPVGTGPFKVKKHVTRQKLILERFDDYFGTDSEGNQLPYLDRIKINMLPEVSTATTSFQSQSIDFLQHIPPQSYSKLSKSNGLTTHAKSMMAWRGLEMNEEREPFSSKKFRLGLAKLTDSKSFVKKGLFGTAKPALSPLSAQYWPKEDSPPDHQKYNPKEGKRLIREAGYEGVEFNIMGRPDELRWSKVLRQMLNEAGDGVINVKLNQLTSSQSSDAIDNQTYDIWIGGGSSIDPDGILYNYYMPDGQFNWTSYSNPKVTKLLKKERGELDRSKRAKQLLKIEKIITKTAPHAYLFHTKGTYGEQNYVKGFKEFPSLRPFHTTWMDK